MTKQTDNLPNFLRAWRKRRGLTQEVLAEKAGLTPGAISQFETGTSNFTIPTLTMLATVLECRPGDILSYAPSEVVAHDDPAARIRALLLSLGVEAREVERATNIILAFLPKKAAQDQGKADAQPHLANTRGKAELNHLLAAVLERSAEFQDKIGDLIASEISSNPLPRRGKSKQSTSRGSP